MSDETFILVEADAISVSSDSTDKTNTDSRTDELKSESPTPSVGSVFKPTTAAEVFSFAQKSGKFEIFKYQKLRYFL